jgi:hypothetical protein
MEVYASDMLSSAESDLTACIVDDSSRGVSVDCSDARVALGPFPFHNMSLCEIPPAIVRTAEDPAMTS